MIDTIQQKDIELILFINNIYKSSWAIYIRNEELPKLLYTGNFLIQGGKYA